MERPELNIHGKNLDEEEREKIARHFEEASKEGLEPVKGEVEKSGEVLRFIGLVNGYLNEDLKEMNLAEFQADPQRIHIIPAESFKKRFPHAEANGMYRDGADGVYVKQEGSRMQAYKSLFHELVHQASFRAVSGNPETRMTYTTRSGYNNQQPTEEEHEHFRGLNEAVVDSIVREIFQKHKDELAKEMNISEEEGKEPVSWYDDYIEIQHWLIRKQ